MNKQILILVIVVAMVLLIGIQTYEISALKNNLVANGIITSSGPTQSSGNNYNSQNTQPTMVGGC